MSSILSFITHSFFVLSALSAVTLSPPLDITKYDGEVRPNGYIVKVKDNVAKDTVRTWLTTAIESNSPIVQDSDLITQDYDAEFFNGFAGTFSDNVLNILRASNDIEYIAEDGMMSTSGTISQFNAPWGCSRLNSKSKPLIQDPFLLAFKYTYEATAGAGVDIYVTDTGIDYEHPDFGGRATWGGTFGPYGGAKVDGNGHGTHVAGIAGSTSYGVAKKATLIAVKVLSNTGSGATSDIVAGLSYVKNQSMITRRPSIASMSLGGSASSTLDSAVNSLLSAGIHVVVSAGNNNVDAGSSSPARVPGAITVGATDITDSRAYYSNYGSVVDIFAPGSNITSTWIDGGAHVLSGTSMAAPHVSGLLACLISSSGNMPTGGDSLKSLALKNVLQNITPPTPNSLANNNVV